MFVFSLVGVYIFFSFYFSSFLSPVTIFMSSLNLIAMFFVFYILS